MQWYQADGLVMHESGAANPSRANWNQHRHGMRNQPGIKKKNLKRITSLFQAGLGLLDGAGQVRVFTPRRGRYPFGKSEKPPRPMPVLSFEPQTKGSLARWPNQVAG